MKIFAMNKFCQDVINRYQLDYVAVCNIKWAETYDAFINKKLNDDEHRFMIYGTQCLAFVKTSKEEHHNNYYLKLTMNYYNLQETSFILMSEDMPIDYCYTFLMECMFLELKEIVYMSCVQRVIRRLLNNGFLPIESHANESYNYYLLKFLLTNNFFSYENISGNYSVYKVALNYINIVKSNCDYFTVQFDRRIEQILISAYEIKFLRQ